MTELIAEMTTTATLAITLFGVAFCLLQTKYTQVSRSLAIFLGAVAVNNAPAAFERVFDVAFGDNAQKLDLIIWLPSALSLAPFFWIYVFTLTSPNEEGPPHLHRHLILPGLAFMMSVVLAVSPPAVWNILLTENPEITSAGPLVVALSLAIIQLAIYPQMALYLFWLVRRLIRHRLMLRDVYASTEQHELRWIYGIAGLGSLYWLAQTLMLVFAFDPERNGIPPNSFMLIASLSALFLMATTTLWGLRQKPPLRPDDPEGDTNIHPIESAVLPSAEKYEKSALSAEVSQRLTRKLRAAMEVDHLHRNPNLSLWILARHIGASPNYISQTLNEVIGENFFDFVNGYRIAEAKTLLATTDETVLNITYDVGFNARSSFYNAFKRVTGQTPTRFRETMSHRDGMDDTKHPMPQAAPRTATY